jgi:putative ABC transport system permease protein
MTGLRYGEGDAAPVPPGYAAAARALPQFSAVVETREVDAGPVRLAAIDPASLGTVVSPPMTSGRLADLVAGTAIVATSLAGRQTVTAEVGGRSATFRVVGSTSAALPGGGRFDALITSADLAALAGPGDDSTVMVKAAPGVGPVASRDALDALSGRYPQVEVNSLADLGSDLDRTVNGLIALFGGLVGTAVLIALFGIANTLSLSVVERTRESATVRALGLTRGQLRATLLVEALLMGLVGALVGIGYGLLYGRLVVAKAFTQIHPAIVVPWSWLAGLVVLAALAGVVAAVLPARRAARASIVSAMAET